MAIPGLYGPGAPAPGVTCPGDGVADPVAPGLTDPGSGAPVAPPVAPGELPVPLPEPAEPAVPAEPEPDEPPPDEPPDDELCAKATTDDASNAAILAVAKRYAKRSTILVLLRPCCWADNELVADWSHPGGTVAWVVASR